MRLVAEELLIEESAQLEITFMLISSTLLVGSSAPVITRGREIVSTNGKSHGLADYAEALTLAISRHAEVLEGTGDAAQIIEAANHVRSAARHYTQKVFATTGWGNVFADLDVSEDAENSPSSEETELPKGEEAPVVLYRHEYELRVHDFEGARRLLESRAKIQNSVTCEDYGQSYTGVVAGLADIDGWQPHHYDQAVIQLISSKWESVLSPSEPG
jgi:hypothetical protein